MARGTDYEDHTHGENWQSYGWMEEAYFVYRTSFPDPRSAEFSICRFWSAGIDYQFEIVLNGKLVHQQEGMFKAIDVVLNDHLLDHNTLEILVFPPPTREMDTNDRRQASRSVKPAVSYGWDWHPRLIPSGIWDDTGLRVCQDTHFESVHVQALLSDDLQQGAIRCQVLGHNLSAAQCVCRVSDPTGEICLSQTIKMGTSEGHFELSIDKPALWWPHDQGPQHRYEVNLQLVNAQGQSIDSTCQRIGFRRVALTMNEGSWDIPQGFPKGRSPAPITLTVNGRQIFAKGTNWVNPDIFPGRITTENYRQLLDLAKEAHFNLLRVWGGGIVNKAAFHELCDEMGLMVWQEFPLACNNYPDDEHYLGVLESEARAIIQRLR